MPRAIDATGKKFGRLTAIRRIKKDANNNWIWEFKCDCGATSLIKLVVVRRGHSQSCGCLQRERTSIANTRHGGSLGKHSLYFTWGGMIARCNYQNHKDFHLYGGRGIKVCRRWRSFTKFALDMGHRPSPLHSLDRINPDGNYTKNNCKWSTPHEQRINQRPRKIT